MDRKLCDQLDRETSEFYRNIPGNFTNITNIVPYPVQTVLAKYEAFILGRKRKVSVWFSHSYLFYSCWFTIAPFFLFLDPVLGLFLQRLFWGRVVAYF